MKTGGHLFDYTRTKDKKDLHKIIPLWMWPISFLIFVNLSSWLNSPTKVYRKRIIGTYQVDDTFFPGKNASWQKAHFWFEVRADNTFVLHERLSDKTKKEHLGLVSWANENPEKWSVSMDRPHHIVDSYPVLYRSNYDFYYVFRSPKFGNMFFRKVETPLSKMKTDWFFVGF